MNVCDICLEAISLCYVDRTLFPVNIVQKYTFQSVYFQYIFYFVDKWVIE
jgi:hypothetical protein